MFCLLFYSSFFVIHFFQVKNQIKDSTKEFENLSREHAKTIKLVDVLERLILIYTSLSKHDAHLNSKHMFKAAAELFEVRCLYHLYDIFLFESQ